MHSNQNEKYLAKYLPSYREEGWIPGFLISLIASVLLYALGNIELFHFMMSHKLLITSAYTTGYLISCFSGAHDLDYKMYGIGLGTILLPGFIVVVLILLFLFFLSRFIPFAQAAPSTVFEFTKNKLSNLKFKKLKKLVKAKSPKVNNAYRQNIEFCGECKREL